MREHRNTRVTYSNGSMLPYIGKEYRQVFDNDNRKGHHSFSFNKGKFIVKSKGKDATVIRTLYEKWLEKRATNMLEKKVGAYSNILKMTSWKFGMKTYA